MVAKTDSKESATPAGSKSRSSTLSRTSRSSGPSTKKRSRSWYDCCCHDGDDSAGSLWPASRFYCCRADMVEDMARERSKHSNNNSVLNHDHMEEAIDEVAEEALPDDTFRQVFNRSHQNADEIWDIINPDVPYVENLPHQLDVGRAFVIEGAVLPDAINFIVNLACGPGTEPDLAFHFNPRLDRHYVARNSRIKGSWEKNEENAALGGSPFRKGQSFVIDILATATGFKVSVNYMHFCTFKYRMPLSKVCRFEIHGDVSISRILHTRLNLYPDRAKEFLDNENFVSIPCDLSVPWKRDLPNIKNLVIGRFTPNLRPGMEVIVTGRVKLLPQKFYVNLQQGCHLWPHPNILLHVNPRFATDDTVPVVVLNSWTGGDWGTEQRFGRCRFSPGQPFKINIHIEEDRYRVMVNGLQQGTMPHRGSPSSINTLVIRGDVFVTGVGVAPMPPAIERLPSPASAASSLAGSLVNLVFPTVVSTSPTPRSEELYSEPDYTVNEPSEVETDLTPIVQGSPLPFAKSSMEEDVSPVHLPSQRQTLSSPDEAEHLESNAPNGNVENVQNGDKKKR